MIVDFVVGGIKIGDSLRHHRIIRQEEEALRQKEMRIKAEAERQRQIESERRNILEKQAEQWDKNLQLRNFIQVVESTFHKQTHDPEQQKKLDSWLAWARQHTDRIDPLKNDFPSIYECDLTE